MKPRPAILLFLLSVAIPVALLAWLGRGMAREESRQVTDQFLALLESRVEEAEQKTSLVLQKTAEQLDEVLTRTATEPEALDGLVNGVPLIKRGFLVGGDGRLVFPDPAAPRHAADEGFLRRTQVIWENNVRFGQEESGVRSSAENLPSPPPQAPTAASARDKQSLDERLMEGAQAIQPPPMPQAGGAVGVLREESPPPGQNQSQNLGTEQSWNYPAGKSYLNNRARQAEVAQSRAPRPEASAREFGLSTENSLADASPAGKMADTEAALAEEKVDPKALAAPVPAAAPSVPATAARDDAAPMAAGALLKQPETASATIPASPLPAEVVRKSAPASRAKTKASSGNQGAAGPAAPAEILEKERVPATPVRSVNSGWHLWFYGDGVHFIYWQRRSDGRVIGAEIERSKLLDAIVAALPSGEDGGTATAPRASTREPEPEPVGEPALRAGKIRLSGARGEKLHEWGGYVIAGQARPLLTRALGAPLEMWRWQYFADPAAIPVVGKGALWAGWTAVGGLILLLAGYAYFEMTRALREARQRVSFVNQVSHELKTPLTNIRLYAEMAGEVLSGEEDHAARDYLAVVKEETERLSRLIHHVLTFSRQERGSQQVRPCAVSLTPLLLAALERWRPAFHAKNFTVEQDFRLRSEVMADADSVAQILDNLLSNVEKYASQGTYLCLRAWESAARALIEVEDRGPGVPGRARQRIFQPFVRLNESLTEGAAGTGIGLTISRQLAAAQGGQITVRHAEPQGAIFQLSLPLGRKGAEEEATIT